MSKKRIISQVGDSTDGEDYEDVEYDISTLKKYLGENYCTSLVLKDIGNQLLKNTEVREKYKRIKKDFTKHITEKEQQKLKELDQDIGRGWGIIINNYHPIDNKILKDSRIKDYFKANKEKIESVCASDSDYDKNWGEVQKAVYYLEKKVEIQNKFQKVHAVNKKIELYTQEQRKDVEHSFAEPVHSQKNASSFLAKTKASKKLDKDLGKIYLYDYKYGTKAHITNTSVTKRTTQQNETLEVYKGGAFSDYVVNEGDYKSIGKRLQRFIDDHYIKEDNLSKFLKASLKGEGYGDIVHDNAKGFSVDLMDHLQTLVKLIFGVEVKRNSAALLTNPMFFDLVDAKVYKVQDIADRIPMAMKGAVSASVFMDKQKNESTYDYRNVTLLPMQLVDNKSQYWSQLKSKIDKKIEELNIAKKVSSLKHSDTVGELNIAKV